MANTSTYRAGSFTLFLGTGSVGTTNNSLILGPGNGNHDIRGPRGDDTIDSLSWKLELGALNSSFWVANNEIKANFFNGPSVATGPLGFWITGTGGSPQTIEFQQAPGASGTTAFNASEHVYFRLRNISNTTCVWESSSTGVSYTTLFEQGYLNGFSPSNISIIFWRLENQANAASIGTIAFSHINTFEQPTSVPVVEMTASVVAPTAVGGDQGSSEESLVRFNAELIEAAIEPNLSTIVRAYA